MTCTGAILCIVGCSADLNPLNAKSILFPVITIQNVSRHYQVTSGGQKSHPKDNHCFKIHDAEKRELKKKNQMMMKFWRKAEDCNNSQENKKEYM